MSGKIVLCRCEDVTVADLQHAIQRGYCDIEEIKRYTGFGTGPCQGKECLAIMAQAIAARIGPEAASLAPFTSRPPLVPTPLGHFAALVSLPKDVQDDAQDDAQDKPEGGQDS